MIRAVLIPILGAAAALVLSSVSVAQDFRALARVIPADSALTDTREGIELRLALSQPVPFRIGLLDGPPRVVIDFRQVYWEGLAEALDRPEGVARILTGAASVAPDWSRLVLELSAPMAVEAAAMETGAEDGSAVVSVRLAAVDAARFAAEAALNPPVMPDTDAPAATSSPPDNGRIVVVLDPGHGGIDPGAQNEGHDEADLMLLFARELREALLRTGEMEVHLTRETDSFVPLPTRVSLARAAGADLFISLHADALAEGSASGATVYTLSEEASDAAAAALAERHDRADLLAGVDLSGSDDVVAGVLMDLARLETAPRADALADALVAAIGGAGLTLHPRAHGEAGFTVLKAADFPSVLIEIGFLSEDADLERILDPDWRARMAGAIRDGILDWAELGGPQTD